MLMALTKQAGSLKWYCLSGSRWGNCLQKQFFSSSVHKRSRQADYTLPREQGGSESDGSSQYKPDNSCVKLHGDWPEECETEVLHNMLVFKDFISESEEDSIMSEIGSYLKRMRYEFDHWDDAIHGFRETERLQWRPENERVLRRVRQLALPPGTPPLRHVHVLDLAADGVIKPHVDSLRFCGSVITGISLLSDAVMRLVNCSEPARRLDTLLPRRSLYIMRQKHRPLRLHARGAGRVAVPVRRALSAEGQAYFHHLPERAGRRRRRHRDGRRQPVHCDVTPAGQVTAGGWAAGRQVP